MAFKLNFRNTHVENVDPAVVDGEACHTKDGEG
jgi:hypothetical protein